MNVLVATDGSKYGRWELNWVATLPFIVPPRVTALHVLDIASLRAPFLAQPVMAGNERYIQEEIHRMEAHSIKTVQEAAQLLASLNLTGRGPQRTRSGRADDFETRAQTGRAPGGGQQRSRRTRPLHARQRVDKSRSSCDLPGARCQGRGGTHTADRIGDRWIAGVGQDSGVCVEQISAGSFDPHGRAGADSCGRDPCDAVGQVSGAKKSR